MKPYQQVTIEECGEPLARIPADSFSLVSPHPYEALGAPYGNLSPYFLRQGVLDKLHQAQAHLQALRPGWQFQIFDAYRPVAVQQFMVDHTFEQLRQKQGLPTDALSDTQRAELQAQVFQFWAAPSLSLATPPPHSTGAAVDLTLVDEQGQSVDMGGAIDEISPRSYPNHYADSTAPDAQQYHAHRCLLGEAMRFAGFRQHPNEWWHFSQGDQLWAWQSGLGTAACYGRVPIA